MCKIGKTKLDTSLGILSIDQLLELCSISENAFCNTWYNVNLQIFIKTIGDNKKLLRLYIGDFQPTMSISTQTCKVVGTYWCRVATMDKTSNCIVWKQIYDIHDGQKILIFNNGQLTSQIVTCKKYEDLQYVYDLQIQKQNNYIINNGIICFNCAK